MNRNKPDCQWFENATEAFFADALTPLDRTRFETHASDCDACAADLAQLRAVDPLMKDLLQYRMVVAQSQPQSQPRLRWARVAALASVPALAGVLALGIALWPQPAMAPPQLVVNAPQPIPSPPKLDKVDGPEPTATIVEKPGLTSTVSSPGGDGPKDALPTEDFAVIDAAGQINKLVDFRGKYFLFGVLSPAQPRTADNLERLYRTFPDLVLIGVLQNRQDPAPRNTTFQTRYNEGSRLLGAQVSDFVLLDTAGVEILRGKLSTADTDALTKSVRTALGPQKKP